MGTAAQFPDDRESFETQPLLRCVITRLPCHPLRFLSGSGNGRVWCLRPTLSLQICSPVQNDGNRSGGGFANRVVDEKFLSVSGYRKTGLSTGEVGNPHIEQGFGHTAFKCIAG